VARVEQVLLDSLNTFAAPSLFIPEPEEPNARGRRQLEYWRP